MLIRGLVCDEPWLGLLEVNLGGFGCGGELVEGKANVGLLVTETGVEVLVAVFAKLLVATRGAEDLRR